MANILRTGERLNVNESLLSRNGQFELLMQQDGNLVLYRRANRHVIWSSGTAGDDVAAAVMQEDGNFVIWGYRNNSFWATNTAGQFGAWLLVHDAGYLMLVRPVSAWVAPNASFSSVAVVSNLRFSDVIS